MKLPSIDIPRTIRLIQDFIQVRVNEAEAEGVIIGLSGGIDSAVVTKLAINALGSGNVHVLFLPSASTPKSDLDDVTQFCAELGLIPTILDIQKIIETYSSIIREPEQSSRLEWMNLKPRIRQSIEYFYANRLNCLVCGTGNKSELMIGYFTKYGDGAADILPIGDVYKTHVYQLGEALEVPQNILKKVPSAGLTEGQTDEEEIGISYRNLDLILSGLERFQTPGEVSANLGLDIAEIKKVEGMLYRSEHKRRGPIVFKIGVRTPHHDWRIPLVPPNRLEKIK
ncbi:MAG: NAD+ synthase [Candidatus Heimdallarchaeota archaeon]